VFAYHQLVAGRAGRLQSAFTGRGGIGELCGGLARDAARWEWQLWLTGCRERFLWRVLDRLDYWLARLWLADAGCGPEP
jgi:hypothetical protein